MSVEEVEPFAEMEEKELLNYGATEQEEHISNLPNNSAHHKGVNGGQSGEVCFAENRF